MKKLSLIAFPLMASVMAGCATSFPHKMEDFHDAALLEKTQSVKVEPSFTAGLTGGAITNTAKLSKSGSIGFQYDTSRSSGENAYRNVTVSSSEAPNLRWEVWARSDSALGIGSRSYKKIMGPFKSGEEAKVMFVNNGIGQSIERNMMFMVYSPTETERTVRLDMSEVRR